jgi:type IV conjugative transfer system protein TraL
LIEEGIVDKNLTPPTIKTLDNKPRVLFWEFDEFLSLVVPLFLGMAFGSLLLALSAIFTKQLYSKIKKKMPFGSFLHKIYWIFPTRALRSVIKTLPPSHNREFIL